MMGYNDKFNYQVDIEDIMRNIKIEDLVVLYILIEAGTNQYFGLTLEDIYEDHRVTENDMSRSKIYRNIDRLTLIDAIGHFTKHKRHYYYVKKNGLAIIKYMEFNEGD